MSTDERGLESIGAALRSYLEVIGRRKWIVAVVTAVCVAAAVALSATADPVYRAQTKIVISRGGGLVHPGLASSQPYTATMSELIRSEVVAQNVIENLHLSMPAHELLSKISTATDPETAVVDVSVDDHDRERAVRIDQEVAVVFSKLVQDRFGQASTAAGASQPLTAEVFDPAHALPGKVSPRPGRNVAISLVLGLGLGLLAALLLERFDPRRGRSAVARGPRVGARAPARKPGADDRLAAGGRAANRRARAAAGPDRPLGAGAASTSRGGRAAGAAAARAGAPARARGLARAVEPARARDRDGALSRRSGVRGMAGVCGVPSRPRGARRRPLDGLRRAGRRGVRRPDRARTRRLSSPPSAGDGREAPFRLP